MEKISSMDRRRFLIALSTPPANLHHRNLFLSATRISQPSYHCSGSQKYPQEKPYLSASQSNIFLPTGKERREPIAEGSPGDRFYDSKRECLNGLHNLEGRRDIERKIVFEVFVLFKGRRTLKVLDILRNRWL